MDLSKSYDFFKPETLKGRVHIIGCGAIGSTVAENLVRFGITNITLYDFDVVEPKNVANQMFRGCDIGKAKVDALAQILCEINPEVENNLKLVNDGWHGQRLAGYVFLCVDNIDLRREIATFCQGNNYVKAMFDFRMRLTDAQHYAADWSKREMIENFLSTMQFSHDEAKDTTPVSACNIMLSVCTSVRTICAYGVQNFINFVKRGALNQTILIDMENPLVDAF